MNWINIPLRTKLIFSMVAGLLLVLSVATAVIIFTATSQQEELAYQQQGNYVISSGTKGMDRNKNIGGL